MAPYKNLKIFNSCSKCSDDKCKRLQQLSHYNFTRSMAVGLTSIYDGEGQNNWFQFYLGISGGDRSQLPNIQSKSNSDSGPWTTPSDLL